MNSKGEHVEIRDLLLELKNEIFYQLNVHKLGIIQKFDPEKLVADIILVDIPYIQYPSGDIKILTSTLLSEVPLKLNATKQGGLTLPIQAGDYCVVYFDDRDKTNWRINGKVQKPAYDSAHNINDCYFSIIAPRDLQNIMQNYKNNATILFYQNTSIELDDKIRIKNTTTDLKTILDNLTTILNTHFATVRDLKILNPLTGTYDLPIDPVSITAINQNITDLTTNVIAKIEALLK